MNRTSFPQKKFLVHKQFSEDHEEEGFVEEKDLYSFIDIPCSSLKLKENKDAGNGEGDESDDEQNYKNLRHRFSLHLPEANPLLDEGKQINYEPKLLYQNIVISLGKHISNQLSEESTDIFNSLKEKHRYKSVTSSPLPKSRNNSKSDLSMSEHLREAMNQSLANGVEDKIIIGQLEGQEEEDNFQQREDKKSKFIFDSSFESGNLMYAFQRNDPKYSDEYDLIICNDINSKGYAQWFYFSIQNKKKNQTVKLNLVNHSKKHSLFKDGMKPAIFSVKKNKSLAEKSWERGGNNIKYYQNTILKEETDDNYYFTLSFSYTFEYDDDTVYFAMSYPYTYTQMVNHLDKTIEKCSNTLPNIFIKKEILCHTISNNAVPLLTITNKDPKDSEQQDKSKQNDNKNKRIAILLARQHPGETVSSFLMQGTIDFLVSDTIEANFLRNKYIFKIVPMVNPDGVLYGNFRCNLSGVDLNRQWSNPNKQLHPSVYNIKKLITKYRQQGTQIDYFIDLHGHSKKLNSFIYACKMDSDLQACCIFPMMLSKLNSILHYPSCTFGLESYKENTARGIAWSSGVNKPNIFTIETSFFGYNNKQNGGKATHFKIEDLFKLGSDIVRCMFAYYMEVNADEATKQQLALAMRQYTALRKSAVVQDIIKNGSNNNYNESGGGGYAQEDSGSDSDPLVDELTVKEKITSVIGIKIAKSIGLVNQQNINSITSNSANPSGSERCKNHNSSMSQQPKRKSSVSTNSTGPSTRNKVNAQNKENKFIQIENQSNKKPKQRNNSSGNENSVIRSGNTVPITYKEELLEYSEQQQDQFQDEQFLTNQSQTLPPDTPKQSLFQFQRDYIEEESEKEKRYQVKVRNYDREVQREQDIKREKEEIYKRRFRITKNTPLNAPKSYNILIDPKTIMKYKSSNIAAFLKTNSFANSYYGSNQNQDEVEMDASLDTSKEQIHKEPRKEDLIIENSFCAPKNRFHAQNGLKGINTLKQGSKQNNEGESGLNLFNPLSVNSSNQYHHNYILQGQNDYGNTERSIKSARSGRLYSAINRLTQQQQNVEFQTSMVIQNQKSNPISTENKKSTTQNGFYSIKNNEQDESSQQQQYYNSDTQSSNLKKSSSFLKKNNIQFSDTKPQQAKNNNLIKNFSKILKENSKKYNCDTRILHLSRNTTSSCSTQRKSSKEMNSAFKLTSLQPGATIAQDSVITQNIDESVNLYNTSSKKTDIYSQKSQNYSANKQNQSLTIEQQSSKTDNLQQGSAGGQSKEQINKSYTPLQNKSQNNPQSQQTGRQQQQNMQSTNNSINEISTPTQKHIRSGTGSANTSRVSYFKNFKMNFSTNQNVINQAQQYELFKNQTLNNKMQAMKQMNPQLKNNVKYIINSSQMMSSQQYDLNDSDQAPPNQWNPEFSHKKLVGLAQQRFSNELSKSTYQTPKHVQTKNYLLI